MNWIHIVYFSIIMYVNSLFLSTYRQASRFRIAKRFCSIRSNNNVNGRDLVHVILAPDVDGVHRKLNIFDTGYTKNCTDNPIVLLCGTAQTISTWSPHVRHFMKHRRVIIPELRCQGIVTDLLPQYGTIEQHVKDFIFLLNLLNISQVDIIGFSFGGRLGLALAAHRPDLVSKLSIMGVPLHRPQLGNAILRSWREGLAAGNLKECAWSFLLNGYSEKFVEKYCDRLPDFVDMIVSTNNKESLYHLMKLTHIENNNCKFSTVQCVSNINCPTQVIASSHDRIAGYKSVEDLSKAIKESHYHLINDCGHLAPFEEPTLWRKLVLDFIL